MRRRAFAMLIVLGVLVVLLSVSASIARARSTRALASVTSVSWLDALTVAQSTEDAIQTWLVRESASIVLDPDSTSPLIHVLDHAIMIEGNAVEIRVLAWDQCAMPGASEHDDLPSDLTGLDELTAPTSIYPDDTHPDRLGARLGTHNPIQSSSRRSNSALLVNVNTTSEERLQEVFRDLGVAIPAQILTARRSGERVNLNSIRVNRSDRYHLIASSRIWSVRTDVTVDRVRVSLWSVYVKRGGTWGLEQRIAIPD